MPNVLIYVSGTGNTPVHLDGPTTFAGTADGIRGREWSYTLGARGIYGVSRPARECRLDVSFTEEAQADALRRLADRDVSMRTPGTLMAGGWWQRCYVLSCQPSRIARGWHSAELTVALLDGVWRRGNSVFFSGARATSGGLDYPHDYPYDLGAGTSAKVSVGGWSGSAASITVYGPAVNPAVTIGGNTYAVDVVVPEGSTLVIDGVERSVKLVRMSTLGGEEDAFAAAHRGSGRGCGEYVFERIPPGEHEVSWSGGFKWQLTWYDEEGEPPWSL